MKIELVVFADMILVINAICKNCSRSTHFDFSETILMIQFPTEFVSLIETVMFSVAH